MITADELATIFELDNFDEMVKARLWLLWDVCGGDLTTLGDHIKSEPLNIA